MIRRIPLLLLIGALTLTACKTTFVGKTDMRYARVSYKAKKGDPEIEKMIAPYRTEMSAVMDEVIGELDVMMTKERPECNMGNWICDMLIDEISKTYTAHPLDFAIQNHGGMRVTSIAPGPLTRGEIFELMPFDNMVTILSAKGKKLMTFINHMAAEGGWPMSREIRFVIRDDKATDVTIGGQPLDPERVYYFIATDYIANGGSQSYMLQEFDREDLPVTLRDTYINHIIADAKAGIIQTAKVEGRTTKQ